MPPAVPTTAAPTSTSDTTVPLRSAFTFLGRLPLSRRAFAAKRMSDGAACVVKVGSGDADDAVAREVAVLQKLHAWSKVPRAGSGTAPAPVALPLLASGSEPLFGSTVPRSYFAAPQAAATLAECSPHFVATYARDLAVGLLDLLDTLHTHHRYLHRDIRPATIALGSRPGTVYLLGWDHAQPLPRDAHFLDLAATPRVPTRWRLDRTAHWSLRAHRTGGPSCPADDVEAALLAVVAHLNPRHPGRLPWTFDADGNDLVEPPAAGPEDYEDSPRSPFLTAMEGRKWQTSVADLPAAPHWLVSMVASVRALAVGEVPPYAALRALAETPAPPGSRGSSPTRSQPPAPAAQSLSGASFKNQLAMHRASVQSIDWSLEDEDEE
ncbi:hypothetical protein H9P43_003579 [Blastocladiella emersonii ATCC 22665]|nr:hypothetical protein H9P43_003579 [Blastocladiella emersonii ATCC 22665]